MRQIDIVMPVGPKDTARARFSLEGIVRNSLNPIRHIYIITPERFAISLPDRVPVHWVRDAEFPFSIHEIQEIFRKKNSIYENASWYYQQLLKFYAFRIIEGLSDSFLILDSDFMFTKKTRFLTEDGKGILAFGYPFKWMLGTNRYPEKVEHIHAEFASRLIPGWSTAHPYGGMQHHMLFQRPILEDLFSIVERKWQREFWKAFIHGVDVHKWNAAAEYVIYHHFALQRHADKITPRHLDACDIIFDSEDDGPPWNTILDIGKQPRYNAVGFHRFLKLRERLMTMDYIPDTLRQRMLDAKYPVFRLVLQNGILTIDAMP